MHILDFIMYFLCASVLWWIMDKLFDSEITEELGGLIGVFVMMIFTVVYFWLFVVGDLNWVDIFNGASKIDIKWLKW